MGPERLLQIYLSDHQAGASGGLALARRIAGQNTGNEYGREMEAIAAEIAADRRALSEIIEAVGAGEPRLRALAARGGEVLGRLKTNGTLLSYSPLSRLLELEAMIMGVTGKLQLWRALLEIAPGDPRLDGERIADLEARAADQRARLEHLHAFAARDALAAPDAAARI